MKIALMGSRGVPANYGGFETCVEELGRRLVEHGHSVTVYCRSSYYDEKLDGYLGMDLVYLPNLKIKSLDTLSHTFVSVLHAIRQPFDVFMVFNAANSPVLLLPRLLGKKIVINTDGLEWKRGKWGFLGRRYYKFSEWLSTKLVNRIVADSLEIQDYYCRNYGIDSSYIPYGAYIRKNHKPELLDTLGLKPREYFFQITRFEPENNPLLTILAYKNLRTEKKLVLVGGVQYESEYSRKIAAEANKSIILPGFIYDKELLNELWCNCYAYVHGNEVGGTNPALLQAMASGCFVLAIDVPFNREVLKECGIFFCKDPEDLAGKMIWTLRNSAKLTNSQAKTIHRIEEQYSWDKVAEQYEALFHELAAGNYPWRLWTNRKRIKLHS